MAMPQQQQGQGKNGGPAPFLIKTHQMVEDSGTDDVISWTEKGETFVVWKPVEFARDFLPNYFKHNNFSSFVRQLNTYGFRKVVPDRWEFANDNFRKGEQSLLSEIQRRKPPSAQVANTTVKFPLSNSPKDEDQSSTSTTSSPPHHQQQQFLSEENEKLKKDNQLLSSELAQAKKQYEALLGFLSNYVDVAELDAAGITKKPGMTKAEEGKKRTEEERVGGGGGVKLFGVCLNGYGEVVEEKKNKRGRCEEVGGGRPKKMVGFAAPWMEGASPVQGTSQV